MITFTCDLSSDVYSVYLRANLLKAGTWTEDLERVPVIRAVTQPLDLPTRLIAVAVSKVLRGHCDEVVLVRDALAVHGAITTRPGTFILNDSVY